MSLRWKWGLIFMLMAFVAPHATRSAPPLIVGLVNEGSLSKQEVAQVKHLLTVIGEGYRHKTGTPMQLKVYLKKADMEKDLLNGKISYLMNFSSLAGKKGFVPFALMGFFGEPVPMECIYVRKNSPYQNAAGLKGKILATRADSERRFLRLAFMMKESPLNTFSELKGSVNDASLIYMVAMGQSEGALIGVWPMGVAAATNPGPVKKLRRLNCVKLCPAIIMASPKVPKAERERLLAFLMNLRREKALAKIQQLFKSTGLVIQPTSKEKDDVCRREEARPERHPQTGFWRQEFRIWSSLIQIPSRQGKP